MNVKNIDEIVAKIYQDILQKIGQNHSEMVYQNAFASALSKLNIKSEKEYALPVFYEDQYVGSKRIDLLIYYKDEHNVEQKYILELKARKHYAKDFLQLFGYSLLCESKGQALVNFHDGWVSYQHKNNMKMYVYWDQEGNNISNDTPTEIATIKALVSLAEDRSPHYPQSIWLNSEDIANFLNINRKTAVMRLRSLMRKNKINYAKEQGYQAKKWDEGVF